MSMRVCLGAGTGVELLMTAAVVADPDWRGIFTDGQASYDETLAGGGRALVRDVVRLGRFGWINLIGPLTTQPGPWTVASLRDWVADVDPLELHRVLAGARRHQLRSRLDDETIAAALAGDRGARATWRRALDDTLLQVSPWLLATKPDAVQDTCLRVIDRLPHPQVVSPLERTTERLEELGPVGLLAEVAPGVTYRTGVLDDVVLVTSQRVAPILVVVDESDRTVIIHPPLADGVPDDAGARLRDVGQALGDDTRIRLLHTLRLEQCTLPDLCEAMGSPRTTLLHHLALLRAAGLVEIEVRAGSPNVYRLRPEGFTGLAAAAAAFPVV